MNSELPVVSVVVLNYNDLRHLPHNMQSLQQLDYPPERLEIILVDNGSQDESVTWVRTNYPEVRIVETGQNLGFAGGNNAGVRAARGEWVAILNPDTRVRPGWLRALVQPVATSNVAAVAARMLTWEEDAIDFGDAALNFMGWGNQPGYGSRRLSDYATAKAVIFACGGAMLVRRDLFLDAGGFDEDYFIYFEDVDFGWRLWLLGYEIVYAPQAIVAHRHHGTTGGQDDVNVKRWLLAERNALFTIVKNYDAANLAQVLPAALLLALQRAYLDVSPDPALYGGVPASAAQPYPPRYYLAEAGRLLRQGQVGALARRAQDELGRRRGRRERETASQTAPANRRPIDGSFDLPPLVLARLLAGREVLGSWDELLAKRAAVQRRRQRADEEIFPLFQWALRSNFGAPRFIQAMNHVVGRFGLEALFAGQKTAGDEAELQQRGMAVAGRLLAVMDRAFALSGAPEEWFRVGGPNPPETVLLREEAVALLAAMNRLLWSLPQLPPVRLLAWLEERIPG